MMRRFRFDGGRNGSRWPVRIKKMASGTKTPSTEVAALVGIPRLQNGDRLSREEFERRYRADPTLKKAELIDGVVYMPSPVRHRHHGKPHFDLISWLGRYVGETPGVE